MSASGGSGATPVKGILKKGKREVTTSEKPPPSVEGGAGSGIQWDEMNIMMTEHPVDKDYGHMKIDEPKTPYHEMIHDDEENTNQASAFSPDELAMKVEAASKSVWEDDQSNKSLEDDYDEESQLTDEQKEHKKKFREWRKHHYDEFRVAKALLQQAEEEEEEESMQ